MDDLTPRVTYDPVRSIDFRITDANCGPDKRFVPSVIAALRAIADGLERDEQRPWYGLKQDTPEPSGFSELTGDRLIEVAFRIGLGPDDIRRESVRIQWAAATQLEAGELMGAPPERNQHYVTEQDALHQSTTEELASLTLAEREALGHVWRVSRVPLAYPAETLPATAIGWRADNGEHLCHVWLEGRADTDTIGVYITQTLRNSGIIGETQQITIIFEELP